MRRPSGSRLVVFAVLACAVGSLPMRADEWAPNLTASAVWHSNATHADVSTDQIDSLQIRGDILASERYALGRDDAIHLTAHLGGEWWPRYRGLLSGSGGARVEWRHQLGVGSLAPVFSVEGALDAVGFKETPRSGIATAGTASLRKRFTDRTRVTLSHEVGWFDARYVAFDRGSSETAVELDQDLTPLMRLTFTARFRDGDVLSYASGSRPDLEAIAPDRADLATFGRPMTAYRIDAHTWSGRVAFLRALDDSTALVAALEWRQSERKTFRFTNNLVSIGIVHQF